MFPPRFLSHEVTSIISKGKELFHSPTPASGFVQQYDEGINLYEEAGRRWLRGLKYEDNLD